METKVYKCEFCGAILCLPSKTWEAYIACPTCQNNMIRLKDDFDLSEIVTEDSNVKQSE